MKIICKDNFDRETRSDEVIAENVHEFYAQFIADSLNDRFSGPNSDSFFRAEPDDYKPYTYKP